MKKLAALLFCIIPLSGCIPAALVAGATAGGAVIYDKRGIKTMASDRNTSSGISNQINQNSSMKGTHVSVATFNNLVLLIGQTPSLAQKQTANTAAENYPGVKRVYNEITVAEPTAFGSRADDTWITTKVKTAMLGQPGLRSTQIKVITENKTVYLLGLISRTQAALAAKTASQVAGVKKVVKVFEYVN